MNKETRKSLEESIQKWKLVVGGKEIDRGSENCALCQLFMTDCRDCPVGQYVNNSGCIKTPWEKWNLHHMGTHDKWWDLTVFDREGQECDRCKKLAQAELDFLKSLRQAEVSG